MIETTTLQRLLVLASFLTMGAAAFITPVPDADPNWVKTVVAVASIGYLISLLLIAQGHHTKPQRMRFA